MGHRFTLKSQRQRYSPRQLKTIRYLYSRLLTILKKSIKTLLNVNLRNPILARRFCQLPSLTGLSTFDACARHGSLTKTARELDVTPGRGASAGQIARNWSRMYAIQTPPTRSRAHRRRDRVTPGFKNRFERNRQALSGHIKTLQGVGRDIGATTAFASLWLQAAQENQRVASGNFRLITLGDEC